ncbi:MAG: OmpW family outer membrane protein [Pseudomonadota bacterium]
MALYSTVCAMIAGAALAQSQGDWTVGVGYASVDPKSDNGTVAGTSIDVESDDSFTFTVEYFVQDNIGIELLAATPFDHDFTLNGVATGSTEHLPPTLSVNYHFDTGSAWKPYVGAGINYTTFSDESLSIDGNLELDDSWGFAVQAGLDYQVSDSGFLRFNLRWFDIDSDATLDGTPIGTVEIDPWLYGVAYVYRF